MLLNNIRIIKKSDISVTDVNKLYIYGNVDIINNVRNILGDGNTIY